jgi:hypothetical protein
MAEPNLERAYEVAGAVNDLMVYASSDAPEMFYMICYLFAGFVYNNFETPEQREGILRKLGDIARALWEAYHDDHVPIKPL